MMASRSVRAAGAALLSFAAIGTITALWPNPLFARMTPAQGFEIWLLVLQSVLLEYFEPARLYVAAAGVVMTAFALAAELYAARSAARSSGSHSRPVSNEAG